MAIKYPGEQKIGYGEAQVFDTSKLAEGAWKGVEKIEKKKKEKKKAEDDFKKNLTNIDVSKIRDVDVSYINSQVNAVSDFFYKNSAAIMNPKLDGGKANMELSRLKTNAVGEVQRSIGIKHEDKIVGDRIAAEPDYFSTHENLDYYDKRRRTPMNSSLWNDYTSPTTTEEIDLTMTGEEKDDFYSKSISGISKTLFGDGEDISSLDEKEREDVIKNASDIRLYDNYEDYYNATGVNFMDEDQFDNLKSEYDEYETKWNESQGTFETVTHGGETTVGLHNQSLNANPMLGDYIEERAANIVNFSDAEITKLATEKVGEGSVHLFETKKKIAKEKIIAGITGGIDLHRFKPEMNKELDNMLKERQQDDPNLTMEDLVLELAEPFVKQLDTDVQWVRDIFKSKPSIINVGNKPPDYDYVAPITNLGHTYSNTFAENVRTSDSDKKMNYELVSAEVDGVTRGGVDVGSVVGTEGGGYDQLNLTTGSQGIKLLEASSGGHTDYTGWSQTSGTYTFNPQFIFPAVIATEKILLTNGTTIMPGERVPVSMDGMTASDMAKYHEVENGEFTHSKVKMQYMLQGTVNDVPAITYYTGTVQSQMENWIKKQTGDKRSINHMNELLGVGNSRL